MRASRALICFLVVTVAAYVSAFDFRSAQGVVPLKSPDLSLLEVSGSCPPPGLQPNARRIGYCVAQNMCAYVSVSGGSQCGGGNVCCIFQPCYATDGSRLQGFCASPNTILQKSGFHQRPAGECGAKQTGSTASKCFVADSVGLPYESNRLQRLQRFVYTYDHKHPEKQWRESPMRSALFYSCGMTGIVQWGNYNSVRGFAERCRVMIVFVAHERGEVLAEEVKAYDTSRASKYKTQLALFSKYTDFIAQRLPERFPQVPALKALALVSAFAQNYQSYMDYFSSDYSTQQQKAIIASSAHLLLDLAFLRYKEKIGGVTDKDKAAAMNLALDKAKCISKTIKNFTGTKFWELVPMINAPEDSRGTKSKNLCCWIGNAVDLAAQSTGCFMVAGTDKLVKDMFDVTKLFLDSWKTFHKEIYPYTIGCGITANLKSYC